MEQRVDKEEPAAAAGPSTYNPNARRKQETNPRMHFHLVHDAGEQLRRTGKKPDRMVGR